MSIRVSDPLFLLSTQTGLSVGELKAKAAAGNPDLEKKQEALKTGEPIPILFGRFRNGSGGVMVQPKITEAYFSNSITEKVFSTNGGTTTFIQAIERLELKYLLVLGEGNMSQMQVRDLFYGTCRRGTFNQVYNGRAGTWSPGNNIDNYHTYTATPNAQGYYVFDVSNLSNGESIKYPKNTYYKNSSGQITSIKHKEYGFPVFCGTSGSYSGLTTLSFEYDLDDADSEDIGKTMNVFIRNGLQVTRLIDSVTAESDNYVDLVKYLFQTNNRLADDLIDDTALTTAANFTDTNSFLFNGAVTESQNLLDWIQQTSVNFLLRITNSGGKFGLQPRLPYNTDYTIKTTQVTPEFTFTEEHVVDGGFEIEYISLEDKQPVCFVIQWRQQPEANFGLVRTVEVRYTGEATSGPFVDIDMSGYCTNENHAVKVGAFRLAQRKFITHHLRLTVREYSYNSTLIVGDLVRVRLRRETDQGEVEYHDKLYEINRIQKTFSSTIVYDLTHFPIDSQGRSIIAREVADAVGAGNTIDVGRTTFDCDENSATDNTSIGNNSGGGGDDQPLPLDTEVPLPQPDDVDSPYPDGPNNPDDPLEESADDTSAIGVSGSNTGYGGSSVTPGNQVAVPTSALPCEGGRVCYYRLDKETGVKTLRECVTTPISGNYFSYITTADISYAIIAEGQCPDSASDDGFGEVIQLGETAPVVPDPTAYSYVRFNGTRTTYDSGEAKTYTHTTQWYQHDGSTQNQYLTVGSAWGAIGGAIYEYKIIDPVFTQPYTSDYGKPLTWSPWVNYYDYVTNQHVGTAGVVGVPWRSHVFAVGSQFTTSGGFGLRLGEIGGVGFNGVPLTPNAVPFGYTPTFTAYLVADITADAPTREARIDGVWEFSNDGSTVLAQWKGTNDNGDPYTGPAI
jgi:hypothetical protein|tara:strand:+ start:4085 stop:6790 length:2706 start_codon:yes stop_codon:yes gene_type:complete